MPIYEYQCKNCGHQLEVMQKFSDEPLSICPECDKPELGKLISSSAFHLKGGGWYVTDVRDKGKHSSDTKGNTSDKQETKSPETKSDDSSSSSGSNNSNDQAAG